MVDAVHVCDDRIRERGGGDLSRGQRTVRATVLEVMGADAPSAPAIPLARPRTRTRGLSSDAGASVELDHVTKEYDTVRALSDVSLAIEPGLFMTLLGPSGSGKTTVLNLIAGLVEPTSGTIRINGAQVQDIPPEKRNVGVVFQHYALFPHLTVEQNLSVPLEMRHLHRTDIRERVGEAMELVGLAGMGARRPRQLSGGQQQRVALARALIYRPPVILMDEPLGALDKNLRQQMQSEIKQIQSGLGLTMIYVTHDQAEALGMSDEITVIDHGRIVQRGRPRELYEQPADEFVATFLGEANLFAGTVGATSGPDGAVRALGPGGLAAVARGGARPSPETRVTIVVRPEDIVLSPAGDPDRATGLPATVDTVAFAGDTLRLQLSTDSGSAIIARLPKATANPPSIGSRVTVSWRESDATFVPASEGEG
jgi:putative spermidine/putrescine transport system ATP-binding protein